MSSDLPAPLEDYGLFGPDSVAWKVHGYPTGFTLAFQRTSAVEMFEPFVLAAVADTGSLTQRPRLRYQRTLEYMATLSFGDSGSAIRASNVLMKIHTHARGLEPVTGQPYDANDPERQLWIHLTAWHSLLYTYEVFGPGALEPAEELKYWAECRRAAELQNIDLRQIPRSRDEMRAYYARMKPRLAVTARTPEILNSILDGGGRMVPKGWPRQVRVIPRLAMRKAVIASMPTWMREMAGLRQWRWTDAAIVAMARPLFAWLHRHPKITHRLITSAAPRASKFMAPALRGVAPLSDDVLTPAAARARHGSSDPRDQYAEILASRHDDRTTT